MISVHTWNCQPTSRVRFPDGLESGLGNLTTIHPQLHYFGNDHLRWAFFFKSESASEWHHQCVNTVSILSAIPGNTRQYCVKSQATPGKSLQDVQCGARSEPAGCHRGSTVTLEWALCTVQWSGHSTVPTAPTAAPQSTTMQHRNALQCTATLHWSRLSSASCISQQGEEANSDRGALPSFELFPTVSPPVTHWRKSTPQSPLVGDTLEKIPSCQFSPVCNLYCSSSFGRGRPYFYFLLLCQPLLTFMFYLWLVKPFTGAFYSTSSPLPLISPLSIASCLLPILSQESATSPQWTSHPILPVSKPHFPDNLSNLTPASFHPCFALLLRSECVPLLMIMFGKSVTALTLIGHNGMTVRWSSGRNNKQASI